MRHILFFLTALTLTFPVFGQQMVIRNPEISQLVKQVNADSLKKYTEVLASFKSRHTLNQDAKDGMIAAQNYVKSKFSEFSSKSNGRLTSMIDEFVVPSDGRRIVADAKVGNVIATLQGTNPQDSRMILVSGHLDSRNKDVMDAIGASPGANDDGSGVALVLELARILSQTEFPATLVFVAFTGEEQGLKGATYLADKAKAASWKIEAVLNNDIVGNSNSSETNISNNTVMRVFSETIPLAEDERGANIRRSINSDNDSPSRQLARYIKEVGERYVDQMEVKLIYRNDRFLRGGDQTPFMKNGFTAVPASLADAPGMPQDVRIDVRGLSNSTSLIWKAPLYGKTKGYYVLMRETSSSMWEKKFYTEETSLKLPYSKDNYFFAVQAVSEQGTESLPVIPSPLTR